MIDEQKVINWLAVKTRADRELFPKREKLTQLRLMKLLYFIQGTYLAMYGEKMFDDKIVNAKHGPIAEAAHKKYSGKREPDDVIDWDTAVKDFSELNNLPKINLVLNSVYNKFADVRSRDMVNLTHLQGPWKNSNLGEELLP